LLTPDHCEALATRAIESEGQASYADKLDGGRSVSGLNVDYLDALLSALPTDARRGGMLDGLVHLLRVRRELAAYSPFSPQQVLDLGDEVVAIRRGTGPEAVTAIVNVSHGAVELPTVRGLDVLTGRTHESLALARDEVVWLVQEEQA
jgi:sucrose phosphorylase